MRTCLSRGTSGLNFHKTLEVPAQSVNLILTFEDASSHLLLRSSVLLWLLQCLDLRAGGDGQEGEYQLGRVYGGNGRVV